MPLNDDGCDPFETWIKAKLGDVPALKNAFVFFDFVQGKNDLPYVRITDDGGGPNSVDMGGPGGRGVVERPNKLIVIAAPDKAQAFRLAKAFDSVFEYVAWNQQLSDGSVILDSLPLFNWRPAFVRADASKAHCDMWQYRRWYEFKSSRFTASGRVGG